MSYVILTSKPGQFRTELTEGLEPLEAYDYLCFGRKRAGFVIARLATPTRIRIVDETPPQVVNWDSSLLANNGQARPMFNSLKSWVAHARGALAK